MFKICTSAAFLAGLPAEERTMNLKGVLHYIVPAFIYFINNNLTFVILTHVDATTFQLISQLKIIFTGVLFRFLLKRHLHLVQWYAICLVACGTAASQIPACNDVTLARISDESHHTPWWGFFLMVVSCFLSALGGIYSEKLLKGKMHDSIHWQNVQLYAWGIFFNLVGTLSHDSALVSQGFLTGYNGWTWAAILNNALNGLAISALLKFSDNIMRVFAHASAIVCTMVANIVLFGVRPTAQVIVAFCVIAISMAQYNTAPSPQSIPEEREAGDAFPCQIEDDSIDDETPMLLRDTPAAEEHLRGKP
mmetsp:Transcript_29185/g.85559  ORF Transcript_29185/g.85559 Transcript_29185/m.85559 type:complete len:307 (+) Transcript_29185:359-1279(+)